METLRYLFYRFYQLMVSVGNEDIAEYASILLMSMMFMLNAVTFFVLFIFYRGQKFM